MTVKLIDVAKAANVSKSTVSQFLNGRYQYMSVSTKNKIEKVIKELNYEPNIIARSLKMKKTNTIGVIVSDIQSPFFAQAFRGIEKYCLKKNYNVILCNSDNSSEKELEYLKMLKSKQVDGIIISYSGANRDFMKDFTKNTPLVVFDKDVSDLDVPTIVSENKKGVYKAIEHFLKLNYEDIGIISMELKDIPSRLERIEGYREALADNNISYDEDKVFFFKEGLNLKKQMKDLFKDKKIPRAVFSFNFVTTIAFLEFCKENKITIPDDVALIGFDEIPYAQLFDTPITVVTQKDYEIGYRSAEILFEEIENNNKNREYKESFSCELIIRKSCGFHR